MDHAVIMAGGSGTRFWPESRNRRPKQFLKIAGEEAMIALTARRLLPLLPPERIHVVTLEEQIELAAEALEPLGVPRANLIAEPAARNTAAAIGLTALELRRKDPEAVFAVLPADHVITPVSAFRQRLEQAFALAHRGHLVTFGIRPTHPATGYGYIELGAPLADDATARRIASFKEKPDRATAERFLRAGTFAWNSGMFVWRADVILDELARHSAALFDGLLALGSGGAAIDARAYRALPSLPIDVAVMERSEKGCVFAVDFTWNDVGSWPALEELHAADTEGNRGIFPSGGELVAHDARGAIAFSSTAHVIALLGVDDVVVVHTPDATLVARKDRCEDVKKIVEALRARGRTDVL
ncbi:MAG: NTP transferase domain-containing protein [Planctomycetes bacterium]|nr:NTP transferase domain-containing protein [Planctomycetota bacterium]